ncbi:DUF262 domain-containing protein [Thioalkalivibrio sp. HK1]|uniref:DUF262 domain-containing protein n=1 Tax=Thioalkalivibrio sp. HK1 TaxID=1469245 RepID=UPI0004708DCA|nr:DUF262 domain-containing protein [Thioalkalivibrio sp. HK1]
MKDIRGDAKNIRALLSGVKYNIDLYQREYLWKRKHIKELLDDLYEKFSKKHEPENERSKVADYERYFLGSIIICEKDGDKYIIDGQQRLTSLTLLLIHVRYLLNRQQKDNQVRQESLLTDLIYSEKFGNRSFNLNIPDREPCMDALLNNKQFDENHQSKSVANIYQRYRDIEEHYPEELSGDALPYFADWLTEKVFLVEITTYSDSDAYTIFETMNDRGLSLTPTDMLKSYLLANITESDDLRKNSNEAWKKHVASLQEIGKEEDADAIKSWLRSQYANDIREKKRDAEPRDFNRIGTEFHRWVQEKKEQINLSSSADFARFMQDDFAFYAKQYKLLREASMDIKSELESVYFNAEYEFTLQYPMLLAPLKRGDKKDIILRKLRTVASYIDIYINRRIWNGKSIVYSTVQHTMFSVIKEIRGLKPEEIAKMLMERLSKDENTFSNNARFRLTGANRKHIRRILARITDYTETQSGQASRYAEYAASGRNSYEIEHIWPNHFDLHVDEFDHSTDFDEYRSRIGGLLLLPKNFNASYKDMSYKDKREHYQGQNLLARSLHPRAYENNPGFIRFIEESDLDFQPHEEFKKADLDARQSLYQKLAEQIWNPQRLLREAKG